MFGFSIKAWLAVGAAALAVLVVVGSYRAGMSAGRDDCEDRYATQRADAADAAATAVRGYIEADAEAARLRASAEALAAQRVSEVRREVLSLPDRAGGGWTAAEYGLLLDAFCARRAGHSACVPDPLRGGAAAPAADRERGPGHEGAADVGDRGAGGLRAVRGPALGLRAGGDAPDAGKMSAEIDTGGAGSLVAPFSAEE